MRHLISTPCTHLRVSQVCNPPTRTAIYRFCIPSSKFRFSRVRALARDQSPSHSPKSPLFYLFSTVILSGPPLDPTSTVVDTAPDFIFAPLSHFILNHPIGSFGLTIVLLTLVLRSSLTLPTLLWARRRTSRTKELVEPEMKRVNRELAIKLIPEFKKKGPEGYHGYRDELRRQMTAHLAALHRRHHTHPFITQWAPLLVNLPILIIFSLTIRHALEIPGNPMALESFGWMQSLGEGDLWIGAVGGGLMMASSETVEYRRRAAESFAEADNKARRMGKGANPSSDRQEEVQPTKRFTPLVSRKPTPPAQPKRHLSSSQYILSPPMSHTSPPSASPPKATIFKRAPKTSSPAVSKAAKSTPTPPPDLVELDPNMPSPGAQADKISIIITAALRYGSVAFFCIAPSVPSGVVLYWVSSLSFSLIQNLVFIGLDRRKMEARLAEIQVVEKPDIKAGS